MSDGLKFWLKSFAKLVFLAVIGVGFLVSNAGAKAQTEPFITIPSPPAQTRTPAKDKDTEASPQTLEQTTEKFLSGNYDDIIERLLKRRNGDYDDSWRVLMVKSLMTLGRYSEARSNALSGVDYFPSSLQLRLLAREAALYQNDVAAANRELLEIKVMIEQRGNFSRSGDNL